MLFATPVPVIPLCPICRVFGRICCKLHKNARPAAATVRGEGHPALIVAAQALPLKPLAILMAFSFALAFLACVVSGLR
jgi:hypothetical protein